MNDLEFLAARRDAANVALDAYHTACILVFRAGRVVFYRQGLNLVRVVVQEVGGTATGGTRILVRNLRSKRSYWLHAERVVEIH